ncbi:MAG: TetR family transcriptional regulator [Limimaricola sp.]|uniref:TetR/AcrR family transcriptional regulator n=1 Tax=Limimaricola sp. TaxID=2211665 RepID=UPI001D4B7DA4|nr:TetR/AcrR family transcriptional regulator [Limimaricola sp.]MBI1418985.1 TetR family transcriptional regulator [Limimaricola sp.]
MTTEKQSGKRAPLTRARVLEGAVAVADAEGIDALSMRRLARALGVEAMSLYNHVDNKDDLLMGMLDHVVGTIDWPPGGRDWVAGMRARGLATYAMLIAHPWASQVWLSLPHSGPHVLAYVERTLAALVAAGFSLPQADHAWNAMDSHIHGFTLQRLNFPFDPADYARAARENLHLIPADVFPTLRALAAEVAAGRHDGLQDFTFGLDLLLDGLARSLRSTG